MWCSWPILSVLTLLLITALYRPFLAISFDPGFARSAGLPVAMLDHTMMMFLSLCDRRLAAGSRGGACLRTADHPGGDRLPDD